MTWESLKAMRRRSKDKVYADKYFVGAGIDIGAGDACIIRYKRKFKKMTTVRSWDKVDGDANFMSSVHDNQYDFVHSSHCLEHLNDPVVAIQNWIRICKTGGHIIVTVPDEEMYEKLTWPPKFNPTHKWSFTIWTKQKRLPKSVILLDIFKEFLNIKIVSLKLIENYYNPKISPDIDQTLESEAECSIEFILRKI